MDIPQFKKLPLMGILRGIKPAELGPLIDTVLAAGLRTLEITLNTPQALSLLTKAVRMAEKDLSLGAGTVLTLDECQRAIESGAGFIVSPNFNPEVVTYCLKRAVPVFPGAFTPSEIYTAHMAGATMVKVFPAKFFGPAYFKEIKGPFTDIELLACGGVNEETIGEFFQNGASAVAFGAGIFKKECLAEKKFSCIAEKIARLIAAYRRAGDDKN